MSPRPVVAVPSTQGSLDLVPRFRRALEGRGPALALYAGSSPPPALEPAGGVPGGVALVVGTSGSTGEPRWVLLSADNLHASAAATHDRLGGPGAWTLALPTDRIAGLQVLVRSVLAGTEPAVVDLTNGFTTAAFAAAEPARTRRADRAYTSLVPTQLGRLLADPAGREALRGYDAVLVGGAATPGALRDRARDEGVRLVTTYGMTETAGGCVYDGAPLRDVRVRVDPGGRISLGGPTVAAGYLHDPAATEFAEVDGVRWFRTGDLGHHEAGLLVVDGRADDVIVTGGLKVAPARVEAAIRARLPGAMDAVVVGLDDPEWGQVVGAALVLDGGHQPPSLADLRGRLRDTLAAHELPRAVVSVPGIPVVGPGKPDRTRVRALFGERGRTIRRTPS